MNAFIVETNQGVFQQAYQMDSTGQQLVDLASVLAAVQGKPVLFYLHGGLVDRNSGMTIARTLSGAAGSGGAFPFGGVAPVQIYVVWNAGILDSLNGLVGDSAFAKACKAVVTFLQGRSQRRVGQKAVHVPEGEVDLTTIYDGLLTDEGLKNPQARATALFNEPAETTLEQVAGGVRGVTTQRSAALVGWNGVVKVCVMATLKIVSRCRDGSVPEDYPFEALAVEEILNASPLGKFGVLNWSQMKKDAQAHGQGDFLKFFNSVLQSSSQVALVGHSTGAVLAVALLEQATNQPANPVKMAFLAPAVTIETFLLGLINRQNWIAWPVTVFNMPVQVEAQDAIKLKNVQVYPCSLLHLVAHCFEAQRPGHLLGMEWYADQPAYKQKLEPWVARLTGHGCVSHGAFDNTPGILKEVVRLIK